jgi:hypothetical protein
MSRLIENLTYRRKTPQVIVKGIAWAATKNDLAKHFYDCGNIKRVLFIY